MRPVSLEQAAHLAGKCCGAIFNPLSVPAPLEGPDHFKPQTYCAIKELEYLKIKYVTVLCLHRVNM